MNVNQTVADAILATAADAVVATNCEGIIQVWNPGAERIFGYRADEALGRPLDIIIPERLRARHWEGFRQVMASGESRYGDGDLLSVPSVRKDGQQISLEFTIVPLKDSHKRMNGVVAVMRDVTRRFEEVKLLKRQLAEATRAA